MPFEIVRLTIRDLLRRRVLVLLALFAGSMVILSFPLRELSIGQWRRIITDAGLGATDLSVSLMAILLGATLIAGDLDRKTLYPLLAKPVSRGAFVAGKYVGLVAIIALLSSVMGLGTLGVLAASHESNFIPVLQSVAGIIVSGATMAGVALMFSCFTSTTLAGIFSLSIALVGHLTSDLAYFGSKTPVLIPRLFMIAFAKILPNLEVLNLKDFATNAQILPSGDFFTRMAYGAAYACLCVALGAAIFSRRDLK
jgi:Cu-processing system permease protein